MTLYYWITKYEQKAEKFILLPGFTLYCNPEKGFFCWRVFGDVLEIDHTCTNDHKWAEREAALIAKKHHCKLIRTQTFRDPASYMRLTKAKINISLSGIRPNRKMYWVFEKEVL